MQLFTDDDGLSRPPHDPPPEVQDWDCGPFGFWPLTFPWGVSWGYAGESA